MTADGHTYAGAERIGIHLWNSGLTPWMSLRPNQYSGLWVPPLSAFLFLYCLAEKYHSYCGVLWKQLFLMIFCPDLCSRSRQKKQREKYKGTKYIREFTVSGVQLNIRAVRLRNLRLQVLCILFIGIYWFWNVSLNIYPVLNTGLSLAFWSMKVREERLGLQRSKPPANASSSNSIKNAPFFFSWNNRMGI